MRHSYIFLGPPGAGKGTQAKMFCEARSWAHISTGDMLRAAMKAGTSLGNKVKEIVDSGKLVSDDLMIDLISDRISKEDCKNGFVLDGFPRTIPQAEALDALLAKSKERLSAAVLFEISIEALLSRLEARRTVEARADDNEEVQKKRLSIYEEQTAPLISYYKNKGNLVTVDSNHSVDIVRMRLDEAFPI